MFILPCGICLGIQDLGLLTRFTTQSVLFCFQDQHQLKIVCPGRVTALAVTPDGDYCVAAIAEKIHIWQVFINPLLHKNAFSSLKYHVF